MLKNDKFVETTTSSLYNLSLLLSGGERMRPFDSQRLALCIAKDGV